MSTDRPTRYLTTEAEEALRQVSTATLSSQLIKRGLRNTFMGGVAPLRPDLRMVGYAFTLRYLPMREDVTAQTYDNTTNVQRLAIEAVGPQDVLVIDARGDLSGATLGDILATRVMVRGAAGIVTDGAFRDAVAIREIDLPTYAAGTHAALSSIRHYPVDMNLPVGCAGVLVMPGDVLVGDGDGVIVIPRAIAEEVAHEALEQELIEEFIHQKIRSGSSIVGVYPPDEQTRAEFERQRKR